MTLEELHNIFAECQMFNGQYAETAHARWRAERAGIRAVVEALRDELLRKEGPDTHNLSERIGLRVAVKMFNDILGDAGNEKAVGGPTREDGWEPQCATVPAPIADLGPQDDGVLIGNQNVEAIINDLHDEQKNKAADPSPAGCEWSVCRDPDGEGHYETQCGNGWMMSVSPPPARDGYNFCPSCGKPITFKGGGRNDQRERRD